MYPCSSGCLPDMFYSLRREAGCISTRAQVPMYKNREQANIWQTFPESRGDSKRPTLQACGGHCHHEKWSASVFRAFCSMGQKDHRQISWYSQNHFILIITGLYLTSKKREVSKEGLLQFTFTEDTSPDLNESIYVSILEIWTLRALPETEIYSLKQICQLL